jgi:hypothetical protein
VTTPMSTDETTDRPQPGSPRRRRRWIGLAVLVAIAVLAVVLLWFQPQVLLYDTVVEDDFPAATPTREGDPDVTTGNDADDDAAVEGAAGEDVVTDTEAADGDATEDAATADADPSPSVAQPVALLTGSFDSRNRYTVTGGATVYELPDTTRILRLEGFESTNGPTCSSTSRLGTRARRTTPRSPPSTRTWECCAATSVTRTTPSPPISTSLVSTPS